MKPRDVERCLVTCEQLLQWKKRKDFFFLHCILTGDENGYATITLNVEDRWVILAIFIIKGFRIIVFIFIVISTTFRLICPLAFIRRLSNSGTFTELRITSFIESTGVTCSDSVNNNRVQVLSIPVLLIACSQN